MIEYLLEMKDQYNEVLTQRWVRVFQDILDQENFVPVQVKLSFNFFFSNSKAILSLFEIFF